MKNFKKYIFLFVILLISLGMLGGCKKKKQDYIGDTKVNTFTVNEDGTILEIACEDFLSTGVDVTTLKDSLKDEVKKFQETNGENSAQLLQYKEEDKFVRVAIRYDSLASCNMFNNTNYRNESATILPDDLIVYDLSGNETLVSEIGKDSYKVFLIDGDYTLTINGGVLYYNSHVTVGGTNNTVVTDGVDTAVLIYR